jgi:uncharacterized membrane protein
VFSGVNFAEVWAATVAGFLSCAIESVDVLTIVFAIAVVRGWTGALAGSLAALLVLSITAGVLVQSLTSLPYSTLHLLFGVLLLLFGLRWLREAMLRAAKAVPQHDLGSLYAKEVAALRELQPASATFDNVAAAKALKIVLFGGMEVVFIVVALGAGGSGLLMPVTAGAAAALLLVVILGPFLYKAVAGPLSNASNIAVGAVLSAYGTLWAGEGIGAAWPGIDLALIGLAVGYLLVAIGGIHVVRRGNSGSGRGIGQ